MLGKGFEGAVELVLLPKRVVTEVLEFGSIAVFEVETECTDDEGEINEYHNNIITGVV